MTLILFLSLFAYFLGSIPFRAYPIEKDLNIDIRKLGSKNIGATNVIRAGNRKIGALTLLLDISKVIIPMMMAKYFDINAKHDHDHCFFSLLGHVFPIWLNFKGKGSCGLFWYLAHNEPVVFIAVYINVGINFRHHAILFPIQHNINYLNTCRIYYGKYDEIE